MYGIDIAVFRGVFSPIGSDDFNGSVEVVDFCAFPMGRTRIAIKNLAKGERGKGLQEGSGFLLGKRFQDRKIGIFAGEGRIKPSKKKI